MAENDMPFELTSVKVPSRTPNWNLDAWKYMPKKVNATSGPPPVIVMAHGFGANKKMGLAQYAEAFASEGYACVVFDYRRFGDSDGTPRECVYTSERLEDYRTVITWVREQKEFDAQRVVVWGTSYAGGHATTLACEQELKLTCAIAQCPYLGKSPKPPAKVLLKLCAYGVADLLRQMVGRAPLYIPAVGQPGTVAGMTSADSVAGMNLLVRDKRDYPNRISASSLFGVTSYNPASKASKIAFPILLVVAEKDALCPPDISLGVSRSSDKVSVTKTAGGHFDLYPQGPDHELSLKAQLEFLRSHVPVA